MSSTPPTTTSQDALAAAQSDLASLRRVYHRLASVADSAQLASILQKLLPRLVQRLGDNHAKRLQAANYAQVESIYATCHATLTDMMNHILQRIRSDADCQLPSLELLQLLVHPETFQVKSDVHAYTKNFALTFLAIPRSPSPWTAAAMLPYLLALRGDAATCRNPTQARSVAHLLLKCLVGLAKESNNTKDLANDDKTTDNNNNENIDSMDEHLEAARKLCQDPATGAATYSLLLDVLLYTNPTPAATAAAPSTLPPPGLSATGADILNNGPSDIAKNWAGEMAMAGNLTRTKLALLTIIAPTRRYALLLLDRHRRHDQNLDDNDDPRVVAGMARTLTLLVVASGDAQRDVADQAKVFLKLFWDAHNRNTPKAESSLLLSQWVALQILPLALGHAQAATVPYNVTDVSLEHYMPHVVEMTLQEKLNLQRRPCDALVTAAALTFVTKQWQEGAGTTMDNDTHANNRQLLALCAWTQRLAQYYLLNPSPQLIKTRVATAQIMEALTMRCCGGGAASSAGQAEMQATLSQLKDVACQVLAKVGQGGATVTSSTQTLEIRDACYGVLSHLARSPVVGRIVMTSNDGSNNNSSRSIETAKLLFTCASKEDERLQPKAVAALDALLSSYERLYSERGGVAPSTTASNHHTANTNERSGVSPSTTASNHNTATTNAVTSSNPWAAPAPATTIGTVDSTPDRASLAKSLLPMLWTASQPYQAKSSRVAAARWSRGILKHLDLVKASHLLCFLAGDADVTAAALARQGLGLTTSDFMGTIESTDTNALPDFADFVHLVFPTTASSGLETRVHHYGDFSWAGKAVTLRYGMECLMADLYGGDDEAVALYLRNLIDTLAYFHENSAKNMSNSSQASSLMDLLDVSSGCFAQTLASSNHARQLLVEGSLGFGIAETRQLVFSAASSRARRYLAEAIGEVYQDRAVWGDCQTISKWFELTKIHESLKACCTEIVQIEKNRFLLGPVHGSLHLGAHLKICTILSMLAKGILRTEDVVANAFADGLTVALSYPGKNAPALHSNLSSALNTILVSLAESIKTYKDGDATDAPIIISLVEAAGVCLAATTSHDSADGNRLGASRMACLDSLTSLLGSVANRKEEEIALRVGEALGQYAGCYNVHVEMHDWGEGYNEELAQQLAPHEHCLYMLLRKQYRLSNPLHRTACAPALLAVVALVAREMNNDPTYGERPLAKTVLYALGEIQSVFLGLLSDPKSKHLARESCCLGIAACHGIIKTLPQSASETSGETSQSLSMRLMRAFGQTTNHGGSAYQETREQAEQRRAAERNEQNSAQSTPDIMDAFGAGTEAGGTANMGEAALGAYREMAAACVSLERPDILYDLLLLSVSHSVWFTGTSRERYGATALIGGGLNHRKMREALQPHLGKLLPKILRACNDPNKQTREQMSSLLAGLTGGGAETRQAISLHLVEVVDVLLKDSASKFWRARVGACGALSDIIVGREWSELGGGGPVLEDDYLYDGGAPGVGTGGRLLRLWRTVLRAIDDVRDAVRQNGLILGRAVRALTLRLCDPSAQDKSSGDKRSRDVSVNLERDASAAAATALRWLVKHGLTQTVPESQGLCVATLIDIIGIARPVILEPSLPELIRSLLLAVSGLEPAALNYVQLRARDENQDLIERARIQFAQSGPVATAVNKCVELLPNSKHETQQEVVVALDAALRLSSGFATRASVADTAAQMCNTCPNAFMFPGLSGTANPSVRLIKAFYYAAEKERGQGAKDKMTHALGNIAAFCPGSGVRSLALRACERYRASTGSNNDPASRRAAAGALRAIVVRATKQLADGGNSNVWSKTVLPIAFLGQKDEEAKVAELMKEVWQEGGSVAQENISLDFGTRVEENLLPELVKECVRALEDMSFSRRVAGSKTLAELCTLGVLSPLRTSGSSDNSDLHPKGLILRAKRRAQSFSIAVGASVRLLKRPRLWGGKSIVIAETVRLISPWLPLLGNKDAVAEILGLESNDETCTWRPLTFSSAKDVLEGDSYFDASKMHEEVSLEENHVYSEVASTKTNYEDTNDAMDVEFPTDKSTEPNESACGELATLSFAGLCRFLVEEALPDTPSATLSISEEFLPYRTAALSGCRDLLKNLPTKSGDSVRRLVFEHVGNRLLSAISLEEGNETDRIKTAPVVVAAVIECVGACLWKPFPREKAEELAAMLQTSGGSGQPAWTVREASATALSQLMSCCDESFLRKPSAITSMISAATLAMQDIKFWRVRVAGLRLVKTMVERSGTATNRNDLALEALLPYKESFQKLLRKALSDSEPNVTSLSSEIIILMSWWV